MSRETCKFFSGAFAGLAWTHAAYAVATSAGVVDAPIFLGRKWGVGYMWTEAVLYSAMSIALGYAGWSTEAAQPRYTSMVSTGDGHKASSGVAPAQPASH